MVSRTIVTESGKVKALTRIVYNKGDCGRCHRRSTFQRIYASATLVRAEMIVEWQPHGI